MSIGGSAAGVIPSGHPSLSFWDRWIYAFHIPAFFFVAGVFAERSLRRGYRDFIISKAAVLLYPYFLWTAIQWGLHRNMARFTNVPAEHYNLLTCIYQPYAEFWFFYALFLICTIFASLAALGFNRSTILLVAGAMFVLCEAGAFPLWVPLIQISEYFIIFALGTVVADQVIQGKANAWLSHLRSRGVICGAIGPGPTRLGSHPLPAYRSGVGGCLRHLPSDQPHSTQENRRLACRLGALLFGDLYPAHHRDCAGADDSCPQLHVHRFWPNFCAAHSRRCWSSAGRCDRRPPVRSSRISSHLKSRCAAKHHRSLNHACPVSPLNWHIAASCAITTHAWPKSNFTSAQAVTRTRSGRASSILPN